MRALMLRTCFMRTMTVNGNVVARVAQQMVQCQIHAKNLLSLFGEKPSRNKVFLFKSDVAKYLSRDAWCRIKPIPKVFCHFLVQTSPWNKFFYVESFPPHFQFKFFHEEVFVVQIGSRQDGFANVRVFEIREEARCLSSVVAAATNIKVERKAHLDQRDIMLESPTRTDSHA